MLYQLEDLPTASTRYCEWLRDLAPNQRTGGDFHVKSLHRASLRTSTYSWQPADDAKVSTSLASRIRCLPIPSPSSSARWRIGTPGTSANNHSDALKYDVILTHHGSAEKSVMPLAAYWGRAFANACTKLETVVVHRARAC